MACKELGEVTESLRFGTALALVGGFLDAYTYICRDGVFANAQTGNIVMFAIGLFHGKFNDALRYLIPIVAFALGVLVVQLINKKFKDKNRFHWRQIVLLVEVVMLALVSVIPSELNNFANIVVSFICAMQVATFKTIDGITCATTMCTGNLRSGTEFLFKYFDTKDVAAKKKGISYYRINLIFVLGAGMGAVFTNVFDKKSIIICAVILGVTSIITQIKLKNCFQ
ncbi:MAG: DUF1275 domain-containing protein [Clostridium sp.]|nr:DUF1275 domain-containing protein [Clostridium sp.]